MRCTSTALVLATLTIGQAVAGTLRHAHFHAKKAPLDAELDAAVEKRDSVNWATVSYTYSSGQTFGTATAASVAVVAATTTPTTAATPQASSSGSSSPASGVSSGASSALLSSDLSKLTSLGFTSAGVNAVSSNGGVWIGSDGPYTNEFSNDSGEDLILVVWGPAASWVNANKPLVTVSLSPGQTTTLSFANGVSGAWSAVYSDTQLVNGQVSNTWGEYTFSNDGVVDVSREVNMSGHTMSIVGPSCTTDMNTCVFVCSSGNVCTTGYELLNCANGSQQGAQYGTFDGAPSGGCGGLGSGAALKTSLA